MADQERSTENRIQSRGSRVQFFIVGIAIGLLVAGFTNLIVESSSKLWLVFVMIAVFLILISAALRIIQINKLNSRN